MQKPVALYADAGAALDLVAALESEFSNREIASTRVLATDITASSTSPERIRMLVMPGGADLPYLKLLTGTQVEIIKQFVKDGGKFLGICAGAYFAANSIIFDGGLPGEISGPRPLQFFPGQAIGPAFGAGTYDPDSRTGARAVEIEILADGSRGRVYYNGGCYFSESHDPNVIVLARFTELPGRPPAIVQVQYGAGSATLCGVHPEFPLELLNCELDYEFRIKQELLRHQQFIASVFEMATL